jgi:predicted nicotinamide N-methyase
MMPSTNNPSRSKARWGILRSALLGREITEDARDASIHRYQGYKLLRKQRVFSLPEAFQDLNCIGDNLYFEILARQSFSGDEGSIVIQYLTSVPSSEIRRIREDLGRRGILAKFDNDSDAVHIQWSFSSFTVAKYILCDTINIYVRERKPKQRISLTELQSHDHHGGVDNTGQTCVWDSECTLAYCLATQDSALYQLLPILSSKVYQRHTIIEVGSGMAGIAGLWMAMRSPAARVILTDGHPESVENNWVHIYMNHLSSQVSCEKLLWSTDISIHGETADLILGSDCTHFEEHHTGLMITIAHILKVGGSAILCQPPRAKSLQNFLNLCHRTTNLWNITHVQEPIIEQKHQESVQDPFYDPNIHRPCIVLLQKLRVLQEEDRVMVNLYSATT